MNLLLHLPLRCRQDLNKKEAMIIVGNLTHAYSARCGR